jgi:hypothetical protein
VKREGRASPARLVAFIAFFAFAGPLLAVFGPPILNKFEQTIGTQPTPPDRPKGVAAAARPFQQGDRIWWWADCRERGNARYSCVLWNEHAKPIVAGTFDAVTTPANKGASVRRTPRLPKPGETLDVGSYHDFNGELGLARPHGWLVPEGWLFDLFAKTKKPVTGDRDSTSRLGESVPMTEEDLRAWADSGGR